MESSECQLCSRFTDGLGGYDAHSLACLHQVISTQVESVTHDTEPMDSFAGQRRTDKYFLESGAFDIVSRFFGNQESPLVSHFAGLVLQVSRQYTTSDIFRKRYLN